MGKVYEVKVNNFSQGMISDPRSEDYRGAQIIKNFDAHTYPKKLVPFYASETGDSDAAATRKQNFCVALNKNVTVASVAQYTIFGLGKQSANAGAQIKYKSLTTGSSDDMTDGGWVTPSDNNNLSTVDATYGATWFELFVYYKKTGLIYGAQDGATAGTGRYIWAFYPNAATAFANGHRDLTSFTNLAQGLVASDDILYIPYDNKIAKNDNGSWTNVALTIPAHYYITSICEYGERIAVACAPLSGIGNSRVFLWDRTATSWNGEGIDWGSGALKVLEELEGRLIGISSTSGISSGQTAVPEFKAKMTIREYNGGTAQVIKHFISSGNSITIPIAKQKVNNFLYFLVSGLTLNPAITTSNTPTQGLWKIGRVSPDMPFSVICDRAPNNDTALTSGVLKGFIVVGDFVLISYQSSGALAVSKTQDTAIYTSQTAYYETLLFNGGDSSVTKKLKSVTVFMEPTPSGTVTLSYQVDAETSYTTIFSATDNNLIKHSAVMADTNSDGVPDAELPHFKEISFRITSASGVVITGFKFEYEIINNDNSK